MTGQTTDNGITKLKLVIAFAIIYFVWGSTYLAIRYALESMPPSFMMGARFLISGIIFFIWYSFKKSPKPTVTDCKVGIFTGVLMFIIGYGILAWAEQFLPSGMAALVVASIPIWMVILHWMHAAENKPDGLTGMGIIIGLVGVALLSGIGDEVLISTDIAGGSVVLGVAGLTFGSISWSYASLYIKYNKTTSISPIFISGVQTLTGGIGLFIFGFITGQHEQFSFTNLSLLSVGSLFYLIIFGTLIAFSAYVWLLEVSTPAKVSTYAYFNPLVAIFLGGIFADEPLTLHMLVGAALIISSIVMINKPWMMLRRKSNNRI